MKSITKSHKFNKYSGFLGFLGFGGFDYFITKDIRSLCMFAFFAYFSCFWISKINIAIPDERYLENFKAAKVFVCNLALIELTVLLIISVLFNPIKEILIFALSVIYASLILAYAVKLYILEEK